MNPITRVVGVINSALGQIVHAVGFGDKTIISEMMVYFAVISLVIVTIKLFLFAYKGMVEEQGSKGTLVLKMFKFLGFRLLLIPLIVFGSAIPLFVRKITPNAYLATTGVAYQVAKIGDDMLSSLKVAYAVTSGEINSFVQAGEPTADDSKYLKAHSNRVQDHQEVQRLEEQAATERDSPTGVRKSTQNALLQARQKLDRSTQVEGVALRQVSKNCDLVKQRIADMVRPEEIQKAQATASMAEKAAGVLEIGGRIPIAGFILKPAAYAAGSIAEGSKERAADLQAGGDPLDDRSTLKKIVDFLKNIGFHACMLPAILGIIAGAIVAMKEAIGILQYGAKLEIMKSLGVSIATIFAPAFMVMFLFEKTEQFAWKFITFLFSMYFGFFAVSYVAGAMGSVITAKLGAMVSTLVVMAPGTPQGEHASWALFMASVGMGLQGLGVGMVTAFVLDIVKSAMGLGQGFFNGTFQAS